MSGPVYETARFVLDRYAKRAGNQERSASTARLGLQAGFAAEGDSRVR